MQDKKRDILVTSALPYANGQLHFGHIIEAIQTDIWVRYQKSSGNTCHYVCASDAHGTPIMLLAEKLGKKPEEFITEISSAQLEDYKGFNINFDNFHSSHSKENKELTETIYKKLVDNQDIEKKTISQAFDTEKNIFLPDRFVKGECPKCNAKDQYGDNCEVCGATYSPTELKNPYSVLSKTTPVKKDSEHYFFNLGKYQDMLKDWCSKNHLQSQVSNKLNEWLDGTLRSWDISRDAPYFGFEIPGVKDKYFYVWLDAPIGYMASFKNLCDKNQSLDFNAYWNKDSDKELYHFIGKDIIYFHALFWPAILHSSGYKKPTAVFAHGYLTVNGEKMSKSRGTFITAKSYLNNFEDDYLRYYFATKLGPGIDDIDLNLEDFMQKVNSDLINKLINLASRCAGFINKKFANKLADNIDTELFKQFTTKKELITSLYENREYNKAMREIMALADIGNRYVDENKPWIMAKEEDKLEKVHEVCSTALNLFKVLITYLSPTLPSLSEKTKEFLNIRELSLVKIDEPLLGHEINKFKAMLHRIEWQQVEKMLEENKASMSNNESKETETKKEKVKEKVETNADNKHISFDDFSKVDLRIVKIINAEDVEGAEKLLKITVDLDGENRTIFAGIKKHYKPEDLIGKLTVMVANLAPRKMRFGISEGMLVLAGGEDKLYLIEPEKGAISGMQVK